MALKLGTLGPLIRRTFDSMSDEEAQDPVNVANAIGDSVETYIEQLLVQLLIGPVPGLGTTSSPGAPTGPGPAPIPGATLFK
jgi:hypothetical protein